MKVTKTFDKWQTFRGKLNYSPTVTALSFTTNTFCVQM